LGFESLRPSQSNPLKCAIFQRPPVSFRTATVKLSQNCRKTPSVIVSEIGIDMTRFASSAHLASWARVCPGTHESAGKRRPAGAGVGNQWLRTALVESAWAAARTRHTHLSAQYRRISRRRGSKRAALAIAHRLLVIAYHVLREEVPFGDLGADYFDRLNASRAKRYHLQRLTELGCDVSRMLPA
jgi:transposase